MSAYQRRDGVIEPRLKYIAINYIKGWLILDILATFPTELFENSNSSSSSSSSSSSTSSSTGGSTSSAPVTRHSNTAHYNKLLRLSRLPRLYRLLRILRLFKIIKLMKNNHSVQRFMDKVKMNAAVGRMIFILIFAFFSVHLVSCFWYLSASLYDIDPTTWVARLSLQDEDNPTLYLECLYWAL